MTQCYVFSGEAVITNFSLVWFDSDRSYNIRIEHEHRNADSIIITLRGKTKGLLSHIFCCFSELEQKMYYMDDASAERVGQVQQTRRYLI